LWFTDFNNSLLRLVILSFPAKYIKNRLSLGILYKGVKLDVQYRLVIIDFSLRLFKDVKDMIIVKQKKMLHWY